MQLQIKKTIKKVLLLILYQIKIFLQKILRRNIAPAPYFLRGKCSSTNFGNSSALFFTRKNIPPKHFVEEYCCQANFLQGKYSFQSCDNSIALLLEEQYSSNKSKHGYKNGSSNCWQFLKNRINPHSFVESKIENPCQIR